LGENGKDLTLASTYASFEHPENHQIAVTLSAASIPQKASLATIKQPRREPSRA
jgi:hypothetical protein